MKYLQILNGALAALGAALGTVLAVVCLMYAVHLDSAPRLRDDMPMLLAATGAFVALGAVALGAFVGHRRSWRLRWALQALPFAALASLALIAAQLRGG